MTIYQHKTNGKQLKLIKIEGNTAHLSVVGDDSDVVKMPKVALFKWYTEMKSEETVNEEVNAEEAIEANTNEEQETPEIEEPAAGQNHEVVEEPEVFEEVRFEPFVQMEQEQAQEPQPEVNTEVAAVQESAPSKNTKAPKQKATRAKKAAAGVQAIPEDATEVSININGIDVKLYEYMATDTTFKTEAVLAFEGNTYRLGSIFKTATNKAYSSYYYKNDSADELKDIQKKGIASAAKLLASHIYGEDSGSAEAILAEIMVISRDLSQYRQEEIA